jgi:hypothetical protein
MRSNNSEIVSTESDSNVKDVCKTQSCRAQNFNRGLGAHKCLTRHRLPRPSRPTRTRDETVQKPSGRVEKFRRPAESAPTTRLEPPSPRRRIVFGSKRTRSSAAIDPPPFGRVRNMVARGYDRAGVAGRGGARRHGYRGDGRRPDPVVTKMRRARSASYRGDTAIPTATPVVHKRCTRPTTAVRQMPPPPRYRCRYRSPVRTAVRPVRNATRFTYANQRSDGFPFATARVHIGLVRSCRKIKCTVNPYTATSSA